MLFRRVSPPYTSEPDERARSWPPPQVAAYCNGRSSVSEYDCLLLQHVLWQTPEQADKIADWLLGQLAADDGVKQARTPGCLSVRVLCGVSAFWC